MLVSAPVTVKTTQYYYSAGHRLSLALALLSNDVVLVATAFCSPRDAFRKQTERQRDRDGNPVNTRRIVINARTVLDGRISQWIRLFNDGSDNPQVGEMGAFALINKYTGDKFARDVFYPFLKEIQSYLKDKYTSEVIWVEQEEEKDIVNRVKEPTGRRNVKEVLSFIQNLAKMFGPNPPAALISMNDKRPVGAQVLSGVGAA